MICQVPFATYGLVKYFHAFTGWKNMRHLENSLFVLALINSIIAPILYFLAAFSRRSHRNNKIKVVRSATEDSTMTQRNSTLQYYDTEELAKLIEMENWKYDQIK